MKNYLKSHSIMIKTIGAFLLIIIFGVIIGNAIGDIIQGKRSVTVEYQNDVTDVTNISDSSDVTDSSDVIAVTLTPTSENEDGSQVIIDSDVLIKGDQIPIRFFDGKDIIAIDPEIRYTCSSDCVEIVDDTIGAYKCLKAKSKGISSVTVEYNGKKASKTIYVHEESEQTNSLVCPLDPIIFSATAEGPGMAEFLVGVEGEVDKKMTAKFYLTESRMGFTVSGEWLDYHTMQCKIVNYLSRALDCQMKIVVVEKGKPENLIGVATLQVNTPK